MITRENRPRRSWFYSKFTLLALLVLLVVFARGAWNMWQKEKVAAASRAGVEQKLAEVSERELFLASAVERLSTDAGVDEEIRRKFSVKKPDEEVVTLYDRQGTPAPVASTTPTSWFDRLWQH